MQRLIHYGYCSSHSHRFCGCSEGYGRPENLLVGSDRMVSSSSRFGSHRGRPTTLDSATLTSTHPVIGRSLLAVWPFPSLRPSIETKS